MSEVLHAVAGGVATLTLNRPESRNALNLEMCDRIISVSREIHSNKEIRLVLIRANGSVFCAGADLKEREGMNEGQVRERRMKGFAAYAALEGLPMPTIAVVQGPAVGSGCEIAGACDFIVATPEASFRTPEALRGSVGACRASSASASPRT
jgi:enoyl-CoA hydratase